MSNLTRIGELGQSLWLDNIQRHMLENGEIGDLIDRGDIRGMTSNPTIFDRAISTTHDYDETVRALAWAGWDAEKIFWELAIEDVRAATDLFLPLYRSSGRADGFVSLEVSPLLAHDTEGTLAQAQQLWARVARPNLMVKIPATREGIPAIRKALAAGVNINVTLIFARERYAQVMEAFFSGLEDRLAAGHPVDHLASVASFFVSRVDSKIDEMLPQDSALRGQAGIANAKLAYQDFLGAFQGDRWERLHANGAQLQRPLWASTSTKDPAYPDTLYVDNLIGSHTVNTLPPKTLDAARDHAKADATVLQGVDEARQLLSELERSGISLDEVTRELEVEGVTSFADSFTDLLGTIEDRRQERIRELDPLRASVEARIAKLESEMVPARLWSHDPSLWTDDDAGQAAVVQRMGWLDSPLRAESSLDDYRAFARKVKESGLPRALVLGMGGSSLTAEVLSSLFMDSPSNQDRATCLGILDSSDPYQVGSAATDFPPESTLYLVSSKSGGTAEVSATYDFFWERARADVTRFTAITDAETSLDRLARNMNFRQVFNADPAVGGRYSALTDFGMVPASLLNLDQKKLIDRAVWMRRQCLREVAVARNPGLTLGAALGEAALAGRDKLTIVADEPLRPMANWLEQLVAESSGKDGKGIVPVPLEPIDLPEVYADDRLFVYFRLAGALDSALDAVSQSGQPVIVIQMQDAYEFGAEVFRWEIAVATACHVLGVNAFDQPDVQESKDRTDAKLELFRREGHLGEGKMDVVVGDSGLDERQAALIREFVRQARPPMYVGINAYVNRTGEAVQHLQRLRVAIRERTKAAVTGGFGPRFQHSTGQLHKGGPPTGIFIQITTDYARDLDIPKHGMSFGTFIHAQALGDYETLRARKRPVLRVRLSRPEILGRLVEAFV